MFIADKGEESEREEVEESSEENSLMYTTAEGENAPPLTTESCEEERAFSVIASAASTEQDSSLGESIQHEQSMDEDVPSTVVEQPMDNMKMDETKSVTETCDSDSSQQTFDLQNTFVMQEGEQTETQQIVDQSQPMGDRDQSTFDHGQSNDSSQSYSNSTYQQTSEIDPVPESKEEVKNLNEETMDVAESTESVHQDSWSLDNRNTFSGQNFITQKENEDEQLSREPESTGKVEVRISFVLITNE